VAISMRQEDSAAERSLIQTIAGPPHVDGRALLYADNSRNLDGQPFHGNAPGHPAKSYKRNARNSPLSGRTTGPQLIPLLAGVSRRSTMIIPEVVADWPLSGCPLDAYAK